MERYIDLYEKIKEIDKDFKMGKEENTKLNKNGKPMVSNERIAIYKRDDIENICFCMELKEDKLVIMYPYYSTHKFIGREKIPKIYKKLSMRNWKKAVEIIQGFESRQIEWIKELAY